MKILKLFLSFIGVVIALIIIATAFFSFQMNRHDNESKRILAQELSALTVPKTCLEKSRTYTPGGVDTNSAWFVHYTCNTTGGLAYDSIVGSLTKRDYKSVTGKDYTVPVQAGGNIFYTFTYKNSSFQASYHFNPGQSNYSTNLPSLRSTATNEIQLSICRSDNYC